MRVKKSQKITLIILLLLMPGVIGLGWKLHSQSPIPSKIRDQVSFSILTPADKNFKLTSESVRYDSATKILTFRLSHGNTSITFTEQATPEIIASFPDMLSRQFDMMKNKKTIVTPAGTVYVATNQDLNQKQVGAMNSKGTLLFAQPNKPLDEDTWRQLFSEVKEVK